MAHYLDGLVIKEPRYVGEGVGGGDDDAIERCALPLHHPYADGVPQDDWRNYGREEKIKLVSFS